MVSLAWIFPGQGSQAVGMGQSLYASEAAARETLDEAASVLGGEFLDLLFSGPEEALKRTENTQPAILAVSVAAARSLATHSDVLPMAMAGHSLGEYSALVCAGALPFSDALRAVRLRGQAMQRAVPEGKGAMAAVLGLSPGAIADACAGISAPGNWVGPANFNEPNQTVIAGDAQAVEAASLALKNLGAKRVLPLPVSAPFHCPLMEPAKAELAQAFASVKWSSSPLRVPVLSNVDARPHVRVEESAALLLEQVVAPVRWVECVEGLRKLGVSHFVELGPGKVLSGLIKRIDKAAVLASVEDAATLGAALTWLKQADGTF